MSRHYLILVGLIAVLTATRGAAQTRDDIRREQRLPALVASPPAAPQPPAPQPPALQPPAPAQFQPIDGEVVIGDQPSNASGAAKTTPAASLHDFLGYRYMTSSTDWIVGSGDEFGMVSFCWDHYERSGARSGLDLGMEFHLLAGPQRTDMPPRVFDFSVGYQMRDRLAWFSYDLSAAVMASSDFEGSAREGIRFPAHAVGFLAVNPSTEVAFGIDYLDRGDIKLLPVAGLVLKPNPEMRFDLVFPRPRMTFRLTDAYRLYLSGELGGGTWAVERVSELDDLATYRDLRASIGVEHVDSDGDRSALEIGYLFARRLEYTSGIGNMDLPDAVQIRLVTRF